MDKERVQKIETIINKIATAQVLLDAILEESACNLPSNGSQSNEPNLEAAWMLNHLNDASKYLDQAYDALSGIITPEQSSSPLLDTLFDSMGSDLLKAMMSSLSNSQEQETK